MQVRVNGTTLRFDVEGCSLVPEDHHLRERPTVLLVHGGPGGFDHGYLKPEFGRLASARPAPPSTPSSTGTAWTSSAGWT